jgi:hypothetical protein
MQKFRRKASRGACRARAPSRLSSRFTDITYVDYNRFPITQTLGSVKSMAAAEVWDAAVLMASAWPLVSGAAWPWAMPLQWQLG